MRNALNIRLLTLFLLLICFVGCDKKDDSGADDSNSSSSSTESSDTGASTAQDEIVALLMASSLSVIPAKDTTTSLSLSINGDSDYVKVSD